MAPSCSISFMNSLVCLLPSEAMFSSTTHRFMSLCRIWMRGECREGSSCRGKDLWIFLASWQRVSISLVKADRIWARVCSWSLAVCTMMRPHLGGTGRDRGEKNKEKNKGKGGGERWRVDDRELVLTIDEERTLR